MTVAVDSLSITLAYTMNQSIIAANMQPMVAP